MRIDLAFSDILLAILTLAACVVAYSLTRTMTNIQRAADQLTKTLENFQGLVTRAHHLSDEWERMAISVRQVTEEGHTILGDFSATSAKIREVIEEGAEQVESLFAPMRYLSLLVTGLKAGFEAYSRMRDKDSQPPGEASVKTEEGGSS